MSNNDLKDNQMERGLNQALYKYLPHSWIDFYKKADRTSYTAYVKHWNSGEMTEHRDSSNPTDKEINIRRLLLRISSVVEEFNEKGKIKDFILPVSQEYYSVRTPDPGLNTDIITEVSPLTFFCGTCDKVHSYNTSDKYFKYNPQKKCVDCSSTIKQLNLVYACECGWGGPVEPIPCKKHKFQSLYYSGGFTFYCGFERHKKIEIYKNCPSCSKRLFTRNALDMGNYIPKTLTMIDLLDSKLDRYLEKNDDGEKVIIAYWLEKIDRKQFQDIIKKGLNDISDDELNEKIETLTAMFVSQFHLPENKAREMAKASIAAEYIDTNIDEAIDFVSSAINRLDNNFLNDLAIQYLEYDTVLHPAKGKVSSLKDAMKVSNKLNTNATPEKYEETARKFGLNYVQASGDIPFVMCSYGFTRKEDDPSKATLVGFPAESKNKKNVYATKLKTEGVLFELDRSAIIKWLLKNNIIDQFADNVPNDLSNITEVKTWFINNINAHAISTFSSIDINKDKITYYVYNLIHSMSHALLRQSANLCGLDKNSLSEYIFPNVPSFLIYCQNSQGLNIGAMFNIFEAYFDKWLLSTKEAISKCIFDPICIDRDHACSGCIYLNEISCVHFNKDLDRRLLIGWYDKSSGERFYGFWEELIH